MAEFGDSFRPRFEELFHRQFEDVMSRHPFHEPTVVIEERNATSIRSEAVVVGNVVGDVHVESNVHVRVKGDVNGNLVVKTQAAVHVDGDVIGDVEAFGSLLVEGEIVGNLTVRAEEHATPSA